MTICNVIEEYNKTGNTEALGLGVLKAFKGNPDPTLKTIFEVLDLIVEAEKAQLDSGLDADNKTITDIAINKFENKAKSGVVVTPTALNSEVLNVDEDLDPNSRYSRELKEIRSGDPKYAMINKYNDNQLLAMLIARDIALDKMHSTLVGREESLDKFKEKFDFDAGHIKDIGLTEEEVLSELMVTTDDSRGDWAMFAVDNMAKEYAKLMGLGLKKDATYNDVKSFREQLATIGGIVLHLAEDADLVVVKNIDTSMYYKDGIKFPWVYGTRKLSSDIGTRSKEAANVSAELGLEHTASMPLREPPNPNRDVKVSKQRFATAKEDLVKAVHNAEATSWTMSMDGWNVIKDLYGITDRATYEANKNSIVDSLLNVVIPGIKFGLDEKGDRVVKGSMVYDDRVSKQSTLDGTQRRIEDFIEFALEQDENSNSEFWFNWFIARNDRLHIRSLVNPQDDKHFARWLMRPKGSSYKVSMDNIDTVLNNFEANISPINGNKDLGKEAVFVMGIVQGFEDLEVNGFTVGSLDKMTGKQIADAYKAIVSADDNVLKSYVRNNPVHVGHAALAYSDLVKLSKGVDFDASVVIEVDGLTNGLAFKMMQQVILDDDGNVSEMFWKVAKPTGIRNEALDNMAQERAKLADLGTPEDDNYRSVGKVWIEQLQVYKGIWSPLTEVLNSSTVLVGEEVTRPFEGVFGDLLDPESGAVRSEAKGAVVPFMYGSASGNNRKSFVALQVNKLLNKLVEANEAGSFEVVKNIVGAFEAAISEVRKQDMSEEEYNSIDAVMLDFDSFLSTEEGIKNEVDKLSTEPVKNNAITSALTVIYNFTHGAAIESALNNILGSWVESNEAINVTMEYTTDMFMLLMANKLNISTEKLNARLNNTKDDSTGYYKFTEDVKKYLYNEVSKAFNRLSVVKQKEILDEMGDLLPMLKGKEQDVSTALILVKENGSTGDENIVGRVKKFTEDPNGEIRAYKALTRALVGPDAGTGAVGNHSQDSGTMVDVLNTFEKGKQPLNVWDALVLSGDQYGAITTYNEKFFYRGVEYSMIKDISEMFSRVDEEVKKQANLRDFAVNWMGKYSTDSKPADATAAAAINAAADRFEIAREKLFSEPLYIAQMGGPAGTAFEGKLDVGYNAYRTKQSIDKILSSKSLDKETRKVIEQILKDNGCSK